MQIVLVLILMPLAYLINSVSPWSNELLYERDHSYWFKAWYVILALHWLNVIFAISPFTANPIRFKDLNFGMSFQRFLIYSIIFFCFSICVCFYQERIGYGTQNTFLPNNFQEHTFSIFISFSAGFCEELIYRGFGLSVLISKGISKTSALIITSLSFLLMHGVNALLNPMYCLFILGFSITMGLIYFRVNLLWVTICIHIFFDFFIELAQLNL